MAAPLGFQRKRRARAAATTKPVATAPAIEQPTPNDLVLDRPSVHTVVADCGVRLTGAVEQVVTSSSGGHSGTMVVLVFFVLAGITVIRFP